MELLTADSLLLRQTSAVKYLRALERAAHVTWWEARETAIDLPEKFILIHPGWHETDVAQSLQLVSFRGGLEGVACQSERLWGYACPLSGVRIEADHIFPRALGGPAKGTNQVWLCSLHNGWKSNDLMGFPWETGTPAWLQPQIDHVERLLTAEARWVHG